MGTFGCRSRFIWQPLRGYREWSIRHQLRLRQQRHQTLAHALEGGILRALKLGFPQPGGYRPGVVGTGPGRFELALPDWKGRRGLSPSYGLAWGYRRSGLLWEGVRFSVRRDRLRATVSLRPLC